MAECLQQARVAQMLQNGAEALDGRRAGRTVGFGQAAALRARQRLDRGPTLLGRAHQPLPAIARAGLRAYQPGVREFLEDARQMRLADRERVAQPADRQTGVACHEIEGLAARAGERAAGCDPIQLATQAALGEVDEIDALLERLLAQEQRVWPAGLRIAGVDPRHVDTFGAWVIGTRSFADRVRSRPVFAPCGLGSASMSLLPYDDRDGYIWLDGTIVPWREAKLHVLSHALHYASCVFEGERVYDGYVFKLTEHSQRLVESARILDMALPFDAAAIDKATRDVVAVNGIVDGYVRPLAWRGAEMMGVSAQRAKIHVGIAAWVWPPYFTADARLKGIRLDWAKYRRPDPATAPTRSKAAGLYMICTLSKHAAEAAGYNDAMMLDWRGFLAEATGANVFLAMDGKLHTPKPDCFLDGITRRTVIDLARARGIEVVERHIQPDDLARTDEVFLTGTAAEVTPVNTVGEHSFEVGAITRQLVEDFDAVTRQPARQAV